MALLLEYLGKPEKEELEKVIGNIDPKLAGWKQQHLDSHNGIDISEESNASQDSVLQENLLEKDIDIRFGDFITILSEIGRMRK